jgi:hypothetical protein
LPCFLSSSSFTLPSLFHSPPRSLITATTPSQASESEKTHTKTHTNSNFNFESFLRARSIPQESRDSLCSSHGRHLSYVSSKLIGSACHARTQRLGLGLGFRFRDFTSWNHSNLPYFDF